MIGKLIEHIKDKKILILGFGKEGQSSYQFIKKIFPQKKLTIADINEIHHNAIKIKDEDKNTNVFLGKKYLSQINDFDLIIKSPGIYLPSSYNNITSQSNLFLKFFGKQTIGITGTKGKSTTSSLIYHILKNCGKDALLVGNIGQPPFNILNKINENTIVVFELSSHQLFDTTQSPSIAVLLNLFPEHLDYYQNINAYKDAKSNIFKYQNTNDIQIYDADQKNLLSLLNPNIPNSNTLSYSFLKPATCFIKDEHIFLNEEKKTIPVISLKEITNLIGKHNWGNIMAATLACRRKKVKIEEIRDNIKSFKSLEHRLEYVGFYANIHFYNDSISTIPEACIMALKALPDTDTLLLGGFDRGLDYNKLYKFLQKTMVRNLIFMGLAGKRMFKEFQKNFSNHQKNCMHLKDLKEAFELIPNITAHYKTCLLSPAAASYDQYNNFEDRGNIFKSMASKL